MPTLSIDLTAPQVQRMQKVIGDAMNLGRDANLAEVKSYWISEMRGLVDFKERETIKAQIVTEPFDPL